MSEFKAMCVYDFEPQPDSCEIHIRTGETVRITRTDVGEGWWEGYNEQQQCGLFPEAYVERLEESAMPPPPPPLPPAAPAVGWSSGIQQLQKSTDPSSDPWNQPPAPPPMPPAPQPSAPNSAAAKMPPPAPVRSSSTTLSEDWDDDWDDDSDADTQIDEPGTTSARNFNDNSAGKLDGKGTIRRNLNRFSTFVKSGGEDYILGVAKIPVADSDKVNVVETEHGYEWDTFAPYTCTVTSPKKETKMKGLKSFIVYQLVPSFSNIQVSRRYKHFDWLHERLEDKFILVPVAPLPDKQVTGRYEENFIEHRMMMLQQWVNRICRHPVLSRCEVWNHFLTCTDEKRWKAGKRRAEKDELVGANFFFMLNVPEKALPPGRMEMEMENFSKFAQNMDAAVKSLQTIAVEEIKRFQGPVKRRFLKMSQGFKSLSAAFQSDTQAYSPALTQAVSHTAAVYTDLGNLYEEQPKYDWERFHDLLHEYRGMLTSFPDMFTIHKGSVQKRKEYERYGVEGRLSEEEVRMVCRRTDVISYGLMAEMSHFQKERVADFTEAMRGFLRNQVSFYRQIADKLEESLQTYENI